MAWIELHQSVWTHAKTYALAEELHIDETYAAAHLARLWSWALDNAPNGDLSGLRPRAIAAGAGWKKSADVFLAALLSAGWVDVPCTLHNWSDYAGKLMDRRARNRTRMQETRAKDVPDTCDAQTEHVLTRVELPYPTVPNRTVPAAADAREATDAALPPAVREIRDTIMAKLPSKFQRDEAVWDEALSFAQDYAGLHEALANAIAAVRRQPNTLPFPGNLRLHMPPLDAKPRASPPAPTLLNPMADGWPDARPEPDGTLPRERRAEVKP